MAPLTVLEKVHVVAGGDTTEVAEGEFRVDTARIGGEKVWVVSRRTLDLQQRPVLDSVWFDAWTLRTLSTVRRDAGGVTRQRFDRRAVHAEHVAPDGRTRRRKTLYEAEPYGGVGIELVIATLPLEEGGGGELPVVEGFGADLDRVVYRVLAKQSQARTGAGAMMIRPVWLVEVTSRQGQQRLWIDAIDRGIMRRERVLGDTAKQVVSRGPAIPPLQYFPVEPLATAPAPSRSLRQGAPAQVVPWTPPPPVPDSGSSPVRAEGPQ